MSFLFVFTLTDSGGGANIVGHIVVGNQGGQSLVASAVRKFVMEEWLAVSSS